jgi:hypothetical protein
MSFDFTNQYISQSYQRVLQTDGSKVYDGTGSLAILEYSGSFSGDFTFAFEESPLTNTKVSVYLDPATGKVSYADDVDNLRTIEASAPSETVRRVRNKLIEVINGGINITGSNPDTFKVIGPSQFTGSVRVDGEVSASIFSGSFVGDGSGLTNLNIDTGSFTTTSSFNNFTSSYNSGSFSGSFVGIATTASFAVSAITASYITLIDGGLWD